jgi:diketogulonate reductase-like aldo/keto reductase
LTSDINSRIILNNGLQIPLIGFGTFKANTGKECYESVRTALDCGYRLIDTASIYGNEADIGRAINDSKVPRFPESKSS